jgi:hypothetical protein
MFSVVISVSPDLSTSVAYTDGCFKNKLCESQGVMKTEEQLLVSQ